MLVAQQGPPCLHPAPTQCQHAGSTGQEEKWKMQCVCPLILSLMHSFPHTHIHLLNSHLLASVCFGYKEAAAGTGLGR